MGMMYIYFTRGDEVKMIQYLTCKYNTHKIFEFPSHSTDGKRTQPPRKKKKKEKKAIFFLQ